MVYNQYTLATFIMTQIIDAVPTLNSRVFSVKKERLVRKTEN